MIRTIKPYATRAEHFRRLRERGMEVEPSLAAQWLASVGYYRLSGYWYPYRELHHGKRADRFVVGTSFTDVVKLYEFDRKLRTLIHDGVERIEVSLRAHLNEMIGAIDPLAYRDARHFRPGFAHDEWMRTVERRVDRARKRNEAIRHHDQRYGGNLPIWALSEVLDFADISRLYEGLLATMQWDIAEQLGVHIDLSSLSKNQTNKSRKVHPLVRWFEQIAIVRNTSAHHARLWNRTFTPVGTAAMRTIRDLRSLPEGQSERVYGTLCVMGVLLESASPGTTWPGKIRNLINNSFAVIQGRDVGEMGFPETWHTDPFWSRGRNV